MKNQLSKYPLVSVIIPARNEESRIGKIVRTVIRQCPDVDVEVIVVDDGSSDRTALEAQDAGATVVKLSGIRY